MKHTGKRLLSLLLCMAMVLSLLPAAVFAASATDYYLVGYINDANHGCEEDYANPGEYGFVNGKLTATFDQDSYVFLKTGDNAKWYQAESYCDDTTCTFFEDGSDRMFIPGGVQVNFTLTENADGSLTLSYTTGAAPQLELVDVYCQAPSGWNTCYAYWWGSSLSSTVWPGETMSQDSTGIWCYRVPSDATGVIFNDYSGNQTANLTVPTDENNMYVFANAYWTTYGVVEETEAYYVAGQAELCGSTWVPNDANNKMQGPDADGLYTKVYYSVPAGTYELKVTNGTWDASWGNGASNYSFTVRVISDVTVYFNPEQGYMYTKAVAAGEGEDPTEPETTEPETTEPELPGPDPADFTYTVLFDGVCQITGYTGSDTQVVVPETLDGYTVAALAQKAFYENKTVTEIILPDTVMDIGAYCFCYCTSLERITLPEDLTAIGDDAFCNCTALKEITLPEGLTTIGNYAFVYCTTLKEIALPEGLTTIGNFAFYKCTALEQITMPEGLTTIGERIFQYCSSLKQIDLPENMEIIPNYTFDGCTSLEQIDLPQSLTTIGDAAFSGCSALKQIDIPASVTTIWWQAFKGCRGLTEITLPETVTTWAGGVFLDCTGLTRVNLPENMTTIPDSMFEGCKSLKQINIPESVTRAGSLAFSGCTSLTEITLPAGVTTYGGSVFKGCTGLTRVNLPENMTTIPYSMFNGCTSLEQINIPASVTSIGGGAFKDCTSLKQVDLPEVLTTIGENAFHNCTALTQVDLPEALTGIGNDAFYRCASLKQISIPKSVNQVGYLAFFECTSLTEVTLPETRITWDYGVFKDCTGLIQVNLPGNMQTIPLCMFEGCTALTQIDLPEALTKIITGAFRNCTGLTKIDIPASVTSIGEEAFKGCTGLETVIFAGSAPSIGTTPFDGVTATVGYPKNNNTWTEEKMAQFGGTLTWLAMEDGHMYQCVVEREATCTSTGLETYTCELCGEVYQKIVDMLPHTMDAGQVVEATCKNYGYTLHTCQVCGHQEAVDYVDPLPHDYTQQVVEATCGQGGYTLHTCKKCGSSYADQETKPLTHRYGSWIVDVEPTLFEEGYRHQVCQMCGDYQGQTLPRRKPETGGYGLAKFTVVHAQTLEPMAGASIYISTEKDGEGVLFTDENGLAEVYLPTGEQPISVYADGCQVRNLTVPIGEGTNKIPAIGLSDLDTYDATLTAEPMTMDEMIDAGIDVSAPGNQHVFKYQLTLSFTPTIDWLSIGYYMNEDGRMVGTYSPSGSGSGSSGGYWTYSDTDDAEEKPYYYVPPTGDAPPTKVYVVDENFYLIIRGEVKWTKEMYDVEMLIVNNSETDYLEDLTATLELPEGLSLAAMSNGAQSLEQYVGYIGKGEQESVHWYVRGDEPGTYGLSARLQGKVMPFNEPIDRVFHAEDPIKVWAGNALRLHFKFPDATYSGDDYPIQVTLKNVSDKSLYGVNHKIQITQGMEIYYSDGTEKTRIETGSWMEKGVDELKPGDEIVIEAKVSIFFESEKIKEELKRMEAVVGAMEGLYDAYQALNIASGLCRKAATKIAKGAAGLGGIIDKADDFGLDKETLEEIRDLMELMSKNANGNGEELVALAELLNSSKDLMDKLEQLGEDPEQFIKDCGPEGLERLLEKLEGMNDAMEDISEDSDDFDIFDSMRTAIRGIPVRFILTSVVMEEDENNTTHIPWSYSTVHVGPRYFGVSDVSKYYDALRNVAFKQQMGGWLEIFDIIPGIDDPLGIEDDIEYIKQVEDEMARIRAKDGTGEITYTASVSAVTRSASGLSLLCDNETTVTNPDGSITFTGSGEISVSNPSNVKCVLVITDNLGNRYTYYIEPVAKHECVAGELNTIVSASGDHNGMAVKCCQICDEVMETVYLTTGEENHTHTYSNWVQEYAPTCKAAGIEVRHCTECDALERRFTDTLEHNLDEGTVTVAPTCYTEGVKTYTCLDCGKQKTEAVALAEHDYSGPTCAVCGETSPGYATVMGTVTAPGSDGGNVTVELISGASVAFSSTGANYRFRGVEPGVYVLKVSQDGYLPREESLVVEEGDFTQNVQIVLKGDFNVNGTVNMGDMARLFAHVGNTSALTDPYLLEGADLTGDGKVNMGDVSKLFYSIRKKKPL